MSAKTTLPMPSALALALLACFGTQAHAAEPSAAPVSIKGERLREQSNVSVVKAKDLERTQAKDLREALSEETGLSVGGGGSAISQKIYIRGLEDPLLSVSVDGARQNGYIYHHQGRTLLDPQLLKSIEVEKGTGSASAGPGALAGAVRYVTKDGRDMLRPGEQGGALLGAGWSDNAGWRGNAALYGKLGESFDAMGWLSQTQNDTYKDGNDTRVAHSASRQQARLGKLGWNLSKDQRLTLGYQSTEDAGDRYLRPHMVAFAASNATPLPSIFSRDTYTANWSLKPAGKATGADVTAYRDNNQNLRTASGRKYGEANVSSGVDATLSTRLGSQSFKYGANFAQVDAEALNANKTYNTAYTNGATNTGKERSAVTGLFVDDVVSLGESWLLGLGARYDRYEYTDNHSQRFSAKGLSPSSSLTWAATDALSTRLSYNSTLRGAGIKETYLLDNGPGTNLYKNDADLKSEKARNIALSTDYTASTWSLKGEVFRQTVDRYITANFIGGQARRFNAGKLTTKGYEISGDKRWTSTTLNASVAKASPKLNDAALNDGSFGAGTPTGRTWKLGLQQSLSALNMDFGWATRYVQSLNTTAADNGNVNYKKGSYTVHDLSASWLPTGKDTLRLRLAIKNLFDKKYYDQATYAYNAAWNQYLGLAEPGRDVRVDLSYKF